MSRVAAFVVIILGSSQSCTKEKKLRIIVVVVEVPVVSFRCFSSSSFRFFRFVLR